MTAAADTAARPGEAADTPAALTQSHEMSAQRLLRRYRKLLWLTVAPVFVLLVLLAQWQGFSQYNRALEAAAAAARTHSGTIDALVANASDHVLDMQRWTQKELARGAAVAPADPAIAAAVRPRLSGAGAADGYTLDRLPDFVRHDTAQLLWVGSATPQPTAQALALLQSLSAVMDMAHLRNPDLAWSYRFGWPDRHLVVYPWMTSAEVIKRLGQPDLGAALARWYGHTVFTGGRPEHNGGRLPYWTEPYVDPDSGALIVSRAAPIYYADQFRGIVGTDLKLSALERLLHQLPGPPWQAWIVDDAGRVVADRAQPVAASPPLLDAPNPPGARIPLLAERLPAGVSGRDINAAALADGQPQAVAGQRLVALRSPVSPWTLVLMAPSGALWLDVLPQVLPYLLIAAALLMVLLIGQSMLQWRIIVPALGVMGYLQQLAQDDSTPEPSLGPRWQPWVLTVTKTFRSLRESLRRERRSEAFKSAVVDHALAAIVIVDGAGRVVEWNPAAETMFRLPRARALGAEALTLIVPQRHRERFGTGAPWLKPDGAESILDKRVEMTGLRADGSEFPVEVIVSRIVIDGVRHFSSIVNDISQRRDAAQQIERQREALRQSEKLTAMGSLLAGVAHELNNPLAIVLGRAGLLEEKCETLPELRADAQRIREAAERCGRIVRTFLNMARSKPAQRSSLSLNDLARAAADMLGYIYRSHDIELRLNLMADLPPVFADGDQIGQVVLNLLVNAQQVIATHAGERRVTLSTGVDSATPGGTSGANVWLRVQDSGAGVAPEVRGRLFEPFFTTKPEGLGTGLGLAVSRTLARDHGGDLVLEPAGSPGEAGASFRLSLPLGDRAARDGAVSTVPSALAEAEPRDAALVLVVDDEPEITALIRTLLESAGHEVASAESGAVALELIEAARFGAVVCDLHMPDMDGAALWREVARRDARLARRFLFVTGDTLSPDARAFLKSTRCAALDKPFTRPDLLAGVAALLA